MHVFYNIISNYNIIYNNYIKCIVHIYMCIYVCIYIYILYIYTYIYIHNRKVLWPNNDANIQYIENTEKKKPKRDNYTTVATEQPKIDIALKF